MKTKNLWLKNPKKQQKSTVFTVLLVNMVWVTGLEPATPRPPVLCATKLRYTQMPTYNTTFFEKLQQLEITFSFNIRYWSRFIYYYRLLYIVSRAKQMFCVNAISCDITLHKPLFLDLTGCGWRIKFFVAQCSVFLFC